MQAKPRNRLLDERSSPGYYRTYVRLRQAEPSLSPLGGFPGLQASLVEQGTGVRWAAAQGGPPGPPFLYSAISQRKGRHAEAVAKRYDEPIEVATEEAVAAPLSFSWRGRRYFVDERLSSWREAGEWWRSAGATNGGQRGTAADSAAAGEVKEREYFRVLAHPAGMGATGDLDADGFFVSCSSVYDIYRDRIKGEWRLARIWD